MLTDKPENYLFCPNSRTDAERTNIHFLVAVLLILAAAYKGLRFIRIISVDHCFCQYRLEALSFRIKITFLLPLLSCYPTSMFEISGIAPVSGMRGGQPDRLRHHQPPVRLLDLPSKQYAVHIGIFGFFHPVLSSCQYGFFLTTTPFIIRICRILGRPETVVISYIAFLRTGMI